MYQCEKEWEREKEIVCVSESVVCEREHVSQKVCVSVRERVGERERDSVCVIKCVCV